jgi:hypothetical protein
MATNCDLAIYQGDDWVAMVTVLNCDGTTADLTGYTAESQIRTGIADQTWQVAAQLLCVVQPPNLISISLTSAQTTLLEQPVYCWDLQIVSPSGIVITILAGAVNMQFEVTRDSTAPALSLRRARRLSR